MLHDIRYALRALRKNPGFTAVAVVTLACGIGANTAIFTLVNALLLRPLAVERPADLLTIFTTDPKNPGELGVSYPNYEDYRDRNSVFTGVLASTFSGATLGTSGEPEQLAIELVSGNFFTVLGVAPAIGRGFRPDEDGAPDAHPVVVLSHALWTRRFGARREVLGQTINLNGHPFTVIGVAPPGFRGTNIFGPALWAPLAMHRQLYFKPELFPERRFLWLNVVGRLKPGIGATTARAGIEAISAQLRQAYPRENEGRGVKLLPVSAGIFGGGAATRDLVTRAGWVLMIVVGMVLVIACANVANLLLARAAVRRREIAIRLSMGAGRGRLLVQLLTESMMLAGLGGAIGFLIGFWVRDLLWSLRPPLFRQIDMDLSMDYRVLLFTLAVSLATGLLFGLAPALETARADLVNELRERSAQSSGGRIPSPQFAGGRAGGAIHGRADRGGPVPAQSAKCPEYRPRIRRRAPRRPHGQPRWPGVHAGARPGVLPRGDRARARVARSVRRRHVERLAHVAGSLSAQRLSRGLRGDAGRPRHPGDQRRRYAALLRNHADSASGRPRFPRVRPRRLRARRHHQ
jgi:predicted permease